MNHLEKIKNLSLILSILIFINILFGPLVRATDSGLACPDWPLCYGKVVPPADFRIWMEVGHRYYSMILGFLVLGLSILIFKTKETRGEFGFLSLLSLAVLLLQVFLGKLTVTLLLNPATVNSHLLNAIFLFSIILTIHYKTRNILQNKKLKFSELLKPTSIFMLFSLILLICQLIAGGRVSSNYAGLACPDWPTCYGVYFPNLEGIIGIQMLHRYLAYLLVVLVILNVILSILKNYSYQSKLFLRMSLYTIGIQIILGVVNVLFKLPVLVTALHTGMGVLVFSLVYSSIFYKITEDKT
jgi:cytochrome c oxidase assembly protein subunit 15